MDEPTTFRILLLGKSGNGKSSLANTIFGETMFKVKNFNDLKTFVSDAKTKCIKGRSITLIDTPGFFDQGRSKDEVKPELGRCFIECAPGPHVFLIVLKMERYTKQEQAVTNEILQYFSDDVLKYAVVVFTHGDQLQEGMKIEQYVSQSEGLRALVEKCGGRCHVFDCKYWKNSERDNDYRSNQFQVGELLVTIDKMLMENTGGFYTNEVLDEVEREIQEEARRIKLSSNSTSEEEIRQLAKGNILKKQMKGAALWIKGSVVALVGLLGVVLAWLISSRVGQTPRVAAAVEAGEAVVTSVVEAGEAVVTSVVEAGEAVVTSVVEAGEPIVSSVVEAGEAVVTSVVEAGEAVVSSVVEAGEPIVSSVVEAGEAVVTSVVEAGEAVVSSVVEAGEAVVTSVVETGEPIASSVVEAGEAVVTSVVEAGEAIASSVVETGEAVVTSVVEAGEAVVTSVVETGEAVVTSVVEAGEAVVTSVVEAKAEIGQSVSLPLSGIFQAAREGPQVLLEALTALYDRTYDPYDLFV